MHLKVDRSSFGSQMGAFFPSSVELRVIDMDKN